MSSFTSHQLREDCSGSGKISDNGYNAEIYLAPEDLLQSVEKINQAGFFIEDVSCLDIKEGFQLAYHFDHFENHHRVCLRVLISRDNPQIPSIASLYPGADWHERECFDFFGIKFKDHPNLLPLLLDPDHDGPPPLIKEENKRKDMYQLFPGWTGNTIKPDSDEFSEAINNRLKTAK